MHSFFLLIILTLFGLLQAIKPIRVMEQLQDRYTIVNLNTNHPLAKPQPYKISSFTRMQSKKVTTPNPQYATLHFNYNGRDILIRLEQNDQLFSKDYVEERQYYTETGERDLSRPTEKNYMIPALNCHYKGYIDSDPNSLVIMHSCFQGWTGVIYSSQGTFGIQPASKLLSFEQMSQAFEDFNYNPRSTVVKQDINLHMIYRTADLYNDDFKPSCGVKQDNTVFEVENHESSSMYQSLHDHIHDTIQSEYRTQVPTKFVANDHLRYLDKASATETNTAHIVSIVTSRYSLNNLDPDTLIVLSSQVTFLTGDPSPLNAISLGTCQNCAPGEVSVDSLINAWHTWRSAVGNTPPHDVGHLFSHHNFESTVAGYAGVGAMCVWLISGGINQVNFIPADDGEAAGSVVAHEIGHNFGMAHDGTSGAQGCPVSGYIMNAVMSGIPTDFSSCSKTRFTEWISTNTWCTCINNQPTQTYGTNAVCGNGIVEFGEDCDCGPYDSCVGIDSCCYGRGDVVNGCSFMPGAVCSELDGCCTSSCTIRGPEEDYDCRPASNTCDITEKCDGVHAACPTDYVKGPGTTCSDELYGSGLCYSGYCSSLNRQCHIDTSQYQNSPYQACPTTLQLSFNNDNFCADLYCVEEGTSNPQLCLLFSSAIVPGGNMQVANGVPCESGSAYQCQYGKCVPSSYLSRDLIWWTSKWSVCETCDDPQSRTSICKTQTADLLLTTVDDMVCSPSNKPIISRLCLNTSLDCIHWDKDNPLDLWARQLSKDFGFNEKADYLRSLADGIRTDAALSQNFDIKDSDYLWGIGYMSIPGIVLAIVLLILILAWNHMRKNGMCCGGINPLEGGYNWMSRWVPYIIAFIIAVVILIFSALGLFYNGEMRRGLTDPNVGASVSLKNFIQQASDLVVILDSPLNYLNKNLKDNIDDSLSRMDPYLDFAVSFNTTYFELTNNIFDTINKLEAITQTITGTPTTIDLQCPTCTTLANQLTSALNVLIENSYYQGNIQEVVNRIKKFKESTDTFNEFFTTYWEPSLSHGLRQLKDVNDSIYQYKYDISIYTNWAEYVDLYRHPSTMAVYCIILLGFVVLLLVGIFNALNMHNLDKTFISATYYIFFFCLILMCLLFALHLPLGALNGDSCHLFNMAETSFSETFNFTKEAQLMVESCLLNYHMTTALNMSGLFTSLLQFSDALSDSYSIDLESSLSHLNFDIISNNIMNLDINDITNYDGSACQTQLDAINVITNPTVFTRSNIDTLVPASYGGDAAELTTRKDAVLTWIIAENLVSDNLLWNQIFFNQTHNNISALFTQADEGQKDLTRTDFDTRIIQNAAFTIHDNAYCGNIGETYKLFKESFCTTIGNSFIYLSLSFLIIGIFSFPLIFIATILLKRMPNPSSQINIDKYLSNQDGRIAEPGKAQVKREVSPSSANSQQVHHLANASFGGRTPSPMFKPEAAPASINLAMLPATASSQHIPQVFDFQPQQVPPPYIPPQDEKGGSVNLRKKYQTQIQQLATMGYNDVETIVQILQVNNGHLQNSVDQLSKIYGKPKMSGHSPNNPSLTLPNFQPVANHHPHSASNFSINNIITPGHQHSNSAQVLSVNAMSMPPQMVQQPQSVMYSQQQQATMIASQQAMLNQYQQQQQQQAMMQQQQNTILQQQQQQAMMQQQQAALFYAQQQGRQP